MIRSIFAAAAMLAGTSQAQAAHPSATTSRMDEIVEAAEEQDAFMGSVLVADDRAVLFDKGFGKANLEWNIPNDGDTKFRLASVTKQFTAAAILLLVEEGKVRLDAPIKTYLTDAPATWDAVTIRHLLSHTGGIPDFTGFDDYQSTKGLPATLDSLVARFRDKPLEFAPGEQWAYSNSGYTLLTKVIEVASGESYAQFVADHLFKPLGMTDSGYDVPAMILAKRASGYSPDGGKLSNAEHIDMTIPQGAGGLYSTTRDLLKWERGLFGGKLLKHESLKLMITPVKEDYSFGLRVRAGDEGTTIAHGGGIEGFNTWLGYDPDRKLTVVVLANVNGPAAGSLGPSLMTLARGGKVTLASERQAIVLPATILAEYVGTYEVSPSFSFVIRTKGDQLTVQATRQPELSLYAERQDEFFMKEVNAQISFTRDGNGTVTGATLHQGGRNTEAKKTVG